MDPNNKQSGPSPHYSLYQREVFKAGGTIGQREYSMRALHILGPIIGLCYLVPTFSVHPEELQESTKKKLNDRGYFYANSNAGLGWTDRANRFVMVLEERL